MQVRSPSPPDDCHEAKGKLFRPWASRLSRQVAKTKRLEAAEALQVGQQGKRSTLGHGQSHQLVLPALPIRTSLLDGPTSSSSVPFTSKDHCLRPFSSSSSSSLSLPSLQGPKSHCHASGHCHIHHHQRHHHQFLMHNMDSSATEAAVRLLKKQRPKRFQCPHCHVAFSNNGQLKGHVRIHTGERPFKCDNSDCGKSFTRNEELTRHKRIHSGLRPYTCPLCTKRFGRKDHLKKHIKTHQQKTSTTTTTSSVQQLPLSATASTMTTPAATTTTTAAAMMMLPYRYIDSVTASGTDVAFMAAIQQSFPVATSPPSSSSAAIRLHSLHGLGGPVGTSLGLLHAGLQPECPMIFW